MNQFVEVVGYYKDYLRCICVNSFNWKMVWDDICCCVIGMWLQYLFFEVYVENLGLKVNINGDEFVFVFSFNFSNWLYFLFMCSGNLGGCRDENGMLDSCIGQFYSDIFFCCFVIGGGGNWQEVSFVGYLVNSMWYDVFLDFNVDGIVLYFFQGWYYEDVKIIVDIFCNDKEE